MHSFTKNDIVNRLLNSFRIFVCISIVMSVFNPVMIASASSGASLSVGSDSVDVGNASVVSISLGNCSNVTNLNFTLSFNESVLEFTDIQNHSGVIGTIINTTSSGSIYVELNGMDNFTEVSSAHVIDVTFKGEYGGSSELELSNITLETTEGIDSLSDIKSGSITVNPANTPVPNVTLELDSIANHTINETENIEFTIVADYTGTGTLSYSIDGVKPAGSNLNDSTGVFNWTPSFGQNTTYDIVFNATDGTIYNTTTAKIIVNPGNIPTPVPTIILEFDPIVDQTINETEYIEFTVSTTYTGTGTLSYSIDGIKPAGSNLNDSTGVFNWTPSFGQNTTYDIVFNATDGTIYNTTTAKIIVNPKVVIPDVFTPAEPANFASATGNFWVLHTWDSGIGNVTDSYNVTYDSVWFNGTSSQFNHSSGLGAHSWSNITVYAYNATSSTLSSGVDVNVQIPNNDVNIMGVTPYISVTEGQEILVDVNSTDLDDDSPIYSCNSSLFDFDESNGVGSWTTDYDDAGIYYVEFSVSDGYGSTDSKVMEITVTNNNRAPVLASIGDQTGTENVSLTFTISATDPDGDDVTYSALGLPVGSDLNTSTGEFSWTPDFDAFGDHSIEFIASANGLEDNETITISIDNSDLAPVLAPIGDHSGTENVSLTFTISATDSDGDDVTYSGVGLPIGSDLNASTGEFIWTPGFDDSGDHSVKFIAIANGLEDNETITISIDNTNRPPLMPELADETVAENDTLVIPLGAFDPDGDELTYLTDFGNGSISNGNFTWTPDFDANGIYNVEFIVNDYLGGVSQSIAITVLNTNRAPDLYGISGVSVKENELVTINLESDDVDGDNVLYSTNASVGTLTGNVFTWTPNYSHNGTHSLCFTADDGDLSDTEMVTIGVNDVNVPPVFVQVGPQNVTEGNTISFTILADAVDGDTLGYTYMGGISTAIISSNPAPMTFSWTPGYNDAGNHSVSFKVSDGVYDVYMQVPINVSNVNRLPELTSLNTSYTVNESETLIINLGKNDLDTDQTISVWVNDTGNATGTLSGDVYTWDTNYLDSGTYNMEFVVSDGIVNTSGTTVVNVNNVNAPPVLNYISSKTVTETENLQFTIIATDVYDNDPLTYSVTSILPNGSTFNPSTQLFSWTPADGQEGTYNVQFNVTDGADFDYQNVSITVFDNEVASTPTSGGSGGGGGGSQSTGEKFENIDFKDYTIKPVVKDRSTVFSFVKENNSIVSLSFVSSLNGGQTKTIIEVLKDTSSLVSGPAPGVVYKNMNIWVGDGKFVPAMVSDAKIMFKVEKSWIDENEIDPSSMTLCRYSGSWAALTTSSSGEDDTYVYFIAESPGFSPFAISSVNEWDIESTIDDNGSPTISENEQSLNTVPDDQLPAQPNTENQETKSSGIGITLVILLGLVGIGFYGYRNRDYYSKARTQLGNPDGKRYRRVKR